MDSPAAPCRGPRKENLRPPVNNLVLTKSVTFTRTFFSREMAVPDLDYSTMQEPTLELPVYTIPKFLILRNLVF